MDSQTGVGRKAAVVDRIAVGANKMDAGPRAGRFRPRPPRAEDAHRERLVLEAVARAREGDGEGLRFLYLSYADNVYGFVRGIVRDEHEAEDVTQQVFAKLPARLAGYEPRGVPFMAWLLRVARNVALDELRRRRPTPCEEVQPLDGRAEGAESAERARGIGQALQALPSEQRSVMVMRHLHGLAPTEIATRLGRSEASVHGLHHRGRQAMQRELRGLGLAPATEAA